MPVSRSSVAAVQEPASVATAALPDLVDLVRYPIEDSRGPGYVRLLDRVRQDLADGGASVLEQFLLPATVERILAEVEPLEPAAFVCGSPHNAYLAKPDAGLPADHPRNRRVVSRKACLAHDEIPAASPLHSLYAWPALQRFIADALGYEHLYAYADPLASINVNFYGGGQELGWHFDNAAFAVTLMLRPAERGGVFEFAPNIRDDMQDGFAALGRILERAREQVRVLAQGPGTLVLFRGARSLHRVTPSFGTRSRSITILSYAPEPGFALTANARLIFYGRTQ
jgi:alkylated DNA repair dioxygenase AlkB